MPIPTDLGLAEFISALVSETMHAVSASLVEQEMRQAELVAALSLDLESFASSYVLDQEVLQYEQNLFEDSIEVGAGVPDESILKSLRIDLIRSDVKDGLLTARGVARIHRELRSVLAERRRAAWERLELQGVPRVIVDEGRILAKLSIEILDDGLAGLEGQPPDSEHAISPRPIRLARPPATDRASAGSTALALALPDAMKGIRLSVRPAHSAAGKEEMGASLYGEVEISLRTVF